MALDDDIKKILHQALRRDAADEALARAATEEARAMDIRRARKALRDLLSDETIKEIIQAGLIESARPTVTVALKNGPAFIVSGGTMQRELIFRFDANPLPANMLWSETSVVERLQELSRLGIEIERRLDLVTSTLFITIEFSGLA